MIFTENMDTLKLTGNIFYRHTRLSRLLHDTVLILLKSAFEQFTLQKFTGKV
jgi:hypothetical protein